MTSQKSTHGGARRGAGRPPLPESKLRKKVAFRFDRKRVAELARKAKAAGMTMTEYLERRI